MFPKLLLTAALTLTSGCSLVLVDGPPDFIPANQPVPEGACTIDRTMPFVDAIGATAGAATAFFSSEGNEVRIGLVLGGVLGYSSFSGFRKVSQCRRRMFQPATSRSSDTLLPWSSPDVILFPPRPVTPWLPSQVDSRSDIAEAIRAVRSP